LLSAPGAFIGRASQAAKAAILFLLAPAIIMLALSGAPALAADVNSATAAAAASYKAPSWPNPFSQPYDMGRCGGYFGVNTIGLAGSVNGANVQPGTQVVQGGIGGVVGYGCPIGASTSGAYWFGEVMADVTNLNGNVNGLQMGGPVAFTERFGVGSPLTSMIPTLWGNSSSSPSSPAVPNLPLLPQGVTAGPGNPYAFVALHEYDVSAYDGLSSNRQWLITYGAGLGIKYRLSNQIVADTFAEYQFASTSFCYGPLGARGCDNFGNRFMVGTQLEY
jgi:hypothetical protein